MGTRLIFLIFPLLNVRLQYVLACPNESLLCCLFGMSRKNNFINENDFVNGQFVWFFSPKCCFSKFSVDFSTFSSNNNLEFLRTKMSPRWLSSTCSVMFHKQLKIDSFCDFGPQNDVLPKKRKYAKTRKEFSSFQNRYRCGLIWLSVRQNSHES